MTPTAQHATQDALTRLSTALDDLLTAPLRTLDRDDVEHAVRTLYALGNRLDATTLHLLRAALDHTTDGTVTDLLATSPVNLSRPHARRDVTAARHTDPDSQWNGRIGGLDGDRGSLARLGAQLTAGNTTLAHVHAAVTALRSIPTPLRRGTVNLEVQMDSGERVWTTQRRADLLDGFFAIVTAPIPWAPPASSSTTSWSPSTPTAATGTPPTWNRTAPAAAPSPSPAATGCCA